jgi:hypothetical protein
LWNFSHSQSPFLAVRALSEESGNPSFGQVSTDSSGRSVLPERIVFEVFIHALFDPWNALEYDLEQVNSLLWKALLPHFYNGDKTL